jgi:hypothetical protein
MPHMNLPNMLLYLQPVLDIKPYLPYSDGVKGAAIPNWLEVHTIYFFLEKYLFSTFLLSIYKGH